MEDVQKVCKMCRLIVFFSTNVVLSTYNMIMTNTHEVLKFNAFHSLFIHSSYIHFPNNVEYYIYGALMVYTYSMGMAAVIDNPSRQRLEKKYF